MAPKQCITAWETTMSLRLNPSDKCAYPCLNCDSKMFTKNGLKLHNKTHRNDFKYPCDCCFNLFKTDAQVTMHQLPPLPSSSSDAQVTMHQLLPLPSSSSSSISGNNQVLSSDQEVEEASISSTVKSSESCGTTHTFAQSSVDQVKDYLDAEPAKHPIWTGGESTLHEYERLMSEKRASLRSQEAARTVDVHQFDGMQLLPRKSSSSADSTTHIEAAVNIAVRRGKAKKSLAEFLKANDDTKDERAAASTPNAWDEGSKRLFAFGKSYKDEFPALGHRL